MLPLLYPPEAAQSNLYGLFSNNGLGFIKNCSKCLVTEELNYSYELEAEIYSNDRLQSAIQEQAYLKAKPNAKDAPQPFQIYKINKTADQIRVNGEHWIYHLLDNAIVDPDAPTGKPSEIWNSVQSSLAFNDQVPTYNVTTSFDNTSGTVTALEQHPIRLREFFAGEQGSMLDVFGGEYHFFQGTIYHNTRRGTDTGICLRCGAGLEDIEYEVSSEFMYTHILPYAEIPTTGGGTWYASLPKSAYTTPISTGNTVLKSKRVLLYDFSEAFTNTYPNLNIDPTDSTARTDVYSKLISFTNKYINQNSYTLRYPTINAKVRTDAGIERLSNVGVGDTIQVYYAPLDMALSAKIIKTTYDCLGEKYTNIELGQPKKSISRFFSNKNIGGL